MHVSSGIIDYKREGMFEGLTFVVHARIKRNKKKVSTIRILFCARVSHMKKLENPFIFVS